jgi:hypothetical protein
MQSGEKAIGLIGHGRSKSVMLGLETLFNIFALNLCFVCLAVTVVGLPLALSAIAVSLYEWRNHENDRVVRVFIGSLRMRPLMKSGAIALPLVALLLGISEVRTFFNHGGFLPVFCFIIGLLTIAFAIGVTCYLTLVLAINSELGLRRVWLIASGLTVRTAGRTMPFFVLEVLIAAAIAYILPALLVVLLPVLLMWSWQRTAIWGASRADGRRSLSRWASASKRTSTSCGCGTRCSRWGAKLGRHQVARLRSRPGDICSRKAYDKLLG